MFFFCFYLPSFYLLKFYLASFYLLKYKDGSGEVLADVESGAWVGAGPIIQRQYEALAIWLRYSISKIRPLPRCYMYTRWK